MRSLPPESSRSTPQLDASSNENSPSTQHGVRNYTLPTSPGSLEQGQPPETHTLPETWEDLASVDGESANRQSLDELSKLSVSSDAHSGQGAEYERKTSTSKATSDGLQFRVVRSSSNGGDPSPFANLPNGMLTIVFKYS